jgi:hypothetical protein
MKSKIIYAAITAVTLLGTTAAFAESNGFTDKDKTKVLNTDRQKTNAKGAPETTGSMSNTNGAGSKATNTKGIPGKPIHANEQGN